MRKDRIYIALSTFAKSSLKPLELLEASGFAYDCNQTGSRFKKDEVIAQLKGYTAVIAGLEPYDLDVLNALPELRAISRCGVGIDNIDVNVAKERNIRIFNTPDAVVQPVAELTIALIFDLLRHVTVHTQLMRQHQWKKTVGLQLAGKTIGIIGLGRIGRRVAQLLKRLDCHVVATDVNPDTVWANQQGVDIVDLNDVLSQGDVVTLHIADLGGHAFQLNQEHFRQMKKGSYLINTARGSLINESDLFQALKNGTIAGAALDVFEQEPYVGPLCDLPNVLLTPHVATLTKESRDIMEIKAVNNVLNFLEK